MTSTSPGLRRYSRLKRQAARRARHAQGPRLFTRLFSLLDWRAARPILARRAQANGLNGDDLECAFLQAGSVHSLPAVFFDIAKELYAGGRYWDDLGLRARAREHYLESALWSFYAQLLPFNDIESERSMYLHCADSYRRAAPYFQHRGRLVSIPYQTTWLSGYLRMPYRAGEDSLDRPEVVPPRPITGRYPLVIIFNSLSSSKEELHYTENVLLNLGIATLSFDYPGTGECADLEIDSLSDEHLGNALFLYLTTEKDVDNDRIALLGLSLGGTIALRLNVLFPDRYRATATLSAPYYHKTSIPLALPSIHKSLNRLIGGSEETFRYLTERFAVGDGIAEIRNPILVAGGGRDTTTLPEETKSIYERARAADKKLILCPNATHNMYEMMPSLRYEIAQWIAQRI